MERPVTRKRTWTIVQVVLAAGVVAFGYFMVAESAPPRAPLGEMPAPLSPEDGSGGGVSLAVQNPDPGIAQAGARWYFNWSHTPHEGVDLPFVPLVCGYPGQGRLSEAHFAEVENAIRANPGDYPEGTLFLVGNEIGYKHQKDGRSPREYAEDFHRCHALLKSIDPSFRVSVGPAILSTDEGITGAIAGAADGLDYLRRVIVEYRSLHGEAIPADYVAATNHVDRADRANLAVFKQQIVALRTLLADEGLRDRGVILTEFGIPTRGSSPQQIEWFMAESVRFVATASDPSIGHPSNEKLVQEWAWFTAQPLTPLQKLRSLGAGAFFLRLAQTSLYDTGGDLTHLGRVYETMMGEPAR